MSETLFWETWGRTGKESWSDWVWWVPGVKQGTCQVLWRDLSKLRWCGCDCQHQGSFCNKNTKEIWVHTEREIGSVLLWLWAPHIRVSVCVLLISWLKAAGRAACSSKLCTGAGKRRESTPDRCNIGAIPPGLAGEILFTAPRIGPRSLSLKEKTKRGLIWDYLNYNITHGYSTYLS